MNGWTWLQYCESRLPITSRLWLPYFCAKTCTVNHVKHHITLQSLGNDGCHPPANSTLEAASAKALLSPCRDLPQIHPTDSVFPRSPGHFQHRSATGSCKYLMVGTKNNTLPMSCIRLRMVDNCMQCTMVAGLQVPSSRQ